MQSCPGIDRLVLRTKRKLQPLIIGSNLSSRGWMNLVKALTKHTPRTARGGGEHKGLSIFFLILVYFDTTRITTQVSFSIQRKLSYAHIYRDTSGSPVRAKIQHAVLVCTEQRDMQTSLAQQVDFQSSLISNRSNCHKALGKASVQSIELPHARRD